MPRINGIAHVKVSVSDSMPAHPIHPAARRAGHLAFAVEDEAELEAWRARFDELRIPHGAIEDYRYGLATTLKEPGAIALEFICPRRKR